MFQAPEKKAADGFRHVCSLHGTKFLGTQNNKARRFAPFPQAETTTQRARC
jgi:hypothetical protein